MVYESIAIAKTARTGAYVRQDVGPALVVHPKMCNNQETTTTSTQKGFRALYSGVPTHQNVTLLVGGKTLWPMFVSALFYALIYLLLVCNKLSSSPTPTRLFISAASGHRVSTKKHNKQANQTSASVTGAF